MSFEIWLAFVVASTVLLIIPGPTVMLVISYALADGRRSARYTVPGVGLGDLTAISLSAGGLGVLLSASSTLFTVVKLVGAAYLIWFGVQMWRASPTDADSGSLRAARTPWAMFLQTFAVTAFNPKSIIFFVAFLPQFVMAGAPILPQLLILVPTFVTLAVLNAAAYAWAAGSMRSTVQRPAIRVWLDRAGGSVLVGAGAAMAAWRRAS